MKVAAPLAALVLVLALAGCSSGEDGSDTTGPSGPTTSADEQAQIEGAANQYRVIWNGTTPRAVACEANARAGIEPYDSCWARDVRGLNDQAGLDLSAAFSALRPVVDPDCARAMARASAEATTNADGSSADPAVTECRRTVEGEG